MARVRITEYAAKKLWFGENYTGYTVTNENFKTVAQKLPQDKTWVVKVDVGKKKRGLAGLVKTNVNQREVLAQAREWLDGGYERCLLEEYIEFSDNSESYASLELTKEGVRIITNQAGGTEVEKSANKTELYQLPLEDYFSLADRPKTLQNLPIGDLLQMMEEYSLPFLEINPYVFNNETFYPLDLACELDSAGLDPETSWLKEHVINAKKTQLEEEVSTLNNSSTATLSLHTLNQNGSILTLLSGGGASLVIMDSLKAHGLERQIINYSEYSGGPTAVEMKVYTERLTQLLLASKANEKKILIAGGVSNFTDVAKTFTGIIEAFKNKLDELKEQKIKILVRRGGLNEQAGLAKMKQFLDENNITNAVYGPDLPVDEVGALIKKL